MSLVFSKLSEIRDLDGVPKNVVSDSSVDSAGTIGIDRPMAKEAELAARAARALLQGKIHVQALSERANKDDPRDYNSSDVQSYQPDEDIESIKKTLDTWEADWRDTGEAAELSREADL